MTKRTLAAGLLFLIVLPRFSAALPQQECFETPIPCLSGSPHSACVITHCTPVRTPRAPRHVTRPPPPREPKRAERSPPPKRAAPNSDCVKINTAPGVPGGVGCPVFPNRPSPGPVSTPETPAPQRVVVPQRQITPAPDAPSADISTSGPPVTLPPAQRPVSSRDLDSRARKLADDMRKTDMPIPSAGTGYVVPLRLDDLASLLPQVRIEESGCRSVAGPPGEPNLDCLQAKISGPDPQRATAPTRDQCALARKSAERFQLASDKMEAELARIQQRKEKDLGYYKEWEDLRAEALRDIYWDILDAIPFDKAFDKFAAMTEYRELAPQLKTAKDALLTAAQLTAGIQADADQERLHKVLEATGTARKALLHIPVDKLAKDDPARGYVENFGRFYEAFAKVLEFYLERRDRKMSWQELADGVKLTIDVGALWDPRVKLGVQIEGFGERGGKWYLARLGMANLDGVLTKDWFAELYLRQRRDGFESFLCEEERTVNMCSQRWPAAIPAADLRAARCRP